MTMHSGVFELTKLTYTRLEDNLILHRGYRGMTRQYNQTDPLFVVVIIVTRWEETVTSGAKQASPQRGGGAQPHRTQG